jgi:hypothetical protein
MTMEIDLLWMVAGRHGRRAASESQAHQCDSDEKMARAHEVLNLRAGFALTPSASVNFG